MTVEEFKTMHLICSGLADEWKRILGLYTHYAGYLTAEMAKSLLILKRESLWDFDGPWEIEVQTLNIKARECGAPELRFRALSLKEENKVLLALWEYLDRWNLDDLSAELWGELMAYLDGLIAKEK